MPELWLLLAGLWLGEPALDAVPDPTLPHGVPAAVADDDTDGTWELTAILVGKGRRLAVINGRTLGVGDAIGRARVIAIDSAAVRLALPEGDLRVPLTPGAQKRPASEKR